MRGQTELPALGIAFVLLTAALVLGIGAAGTAFSTAERPALERQAAVSLSDQLVSDDAPLTARENVLRASAVSKLNASMAEQYDLPEGDIRVQLNGQTIARRGSGDGTTIERIVLVENRTTETVRPSFDGTLATTLPRRTYNTSVTISPGRTTVRRVRANDEVLLANTSGLVGTFSLSLSPLETTRLRFEAAGKPPEGSIEISYETPETRKATLAVTVDA